MHDADHTAAHVAAIANACWWIRHHSRPAATAQRAQAIVALGIAARAALDASRDDEAILYAIAIGLFDRSDRRFNV